MDRVPEYSILEKAIEKYTDPMIGGCEFKDVPWFIDFDTAMITCPSPDLLAKSDTKSFVGSAEQGFLQLEVEKKLPKGKFVACTPCFRFGDNQDDLHQEQFMKVELYQNDIVNEDELNHMIIVASTVMRGFLTLEQCTLLETVKTDDGFDINLNGIEVGSYGIRRHQDIEWVYGTGIALPRFTNAIRTINHP